MHDLEDFAAGSESRQTRQGSFAAPADADEQRVAMGHAEDALDACQMLQRVVEQNQVYGGVALVVFLRDLEGHETKSEKCR